MNQIKIGYDDNLGLPSDFSSSVGCETVAYHELADMITAFKQEEIWGMFMPAGTLPYLEEGEIVAQAIFSSQHKVVLQSNFVSTKPISMPDLPMLTLGRINPYCTTSFWAPLIHLMRVFPKDTILAFEETTGFQDLLHKTATGKIAAAMIWEFILNRTPGDAKEVHELFYKSDLPTPIIFGRPGEQSKLKEKITHYTTQDSDCFFRGFREPEPKVLEPFIADMKTASEHFQIVMH